MRVILRVIFTVRRVRYWGSVSLKAKGGVIYRLVKGEDL